MDFKSANVLAVLGGVASEALDLTGLFYSGKPSIVKRKINQPSRTGRDASLREFRASSGDLARLASSDRTNVAQYAYGLAALGCQLHAMGLTDMPKVDPNGSIAAALMDMYQSMGDALAQQYGGCAAHNSVFPERQGRWRATTQSREFLKSIKRYYSNAYTDGEKQDAINLYLFLPVIFYY
ncbi:hypothetical protein Pint_07029 [Pistacia integerrima]|uniref:Uncharacterized protein n=1 Tax=Pistacia integerrima TaxID=434235 RepID=A0ACC0Y0H7_9ROSI|nr:hypothetical protein Pint_07029 [Pistacia integerrima]